MKKLSLLCISLFFVNILNGQFNSGVTALIPQYTGNPICGSSPSISSSLKFEYGGMNSSVNSFPLCTRPFTFTLSVSNGLSFPMLPNGGVFNYFNLTYTNENKSSILGTQIAEIPLGIYEFTINFSTPAVPNQSFVMGLNTQLAVGTGACSSTNSNPNDNSTSYSSSLSSICAALPIKLKAFNVKNYNDVNFLDWRSESETNFSHFEVERSTDGNLYTNIGRVEGNNAEKGYTHLDRNPIEGINYYRLKMVDIDGTFIYSDVKAVEMLSQKNGDVDVFPNPFTGGFTVRGLDKDATVKIYDSRGALVFDQKSNYRLLRVDLPNLAAGLYNAVINSDGKTTTKNIIKVD